MSTVQDCQEQRDLTITGSWRLMNKFLHGLIKQELQKFQLMVHLFKKKALNIAKELQLFEFKAYYGGLQDLKVIIQTLQKLYNINSKAYFLILNLLKLILNV